MNNIEILEEFINDFNEFKEKRDLNLFVMTCEEKQALENLIQENKELEEKLKKEQISHKNDSDSMAEINTLITQDIEDCIKIIEKYRFCKVEKLKDFYKEIKEVIEGE